MARHQATMAQRESLAATGVDQAIDALFGHTVAGVGAKLRVRDTPRRSTGSPPTDPARFRG
jgi:hypothetical protein